MKTKRNTSEILTIVAGAIIITGMCGASFFYGYSQAYTRVSYGEPFVLANYVLMVLSFGFLMWMLYFFLAKSLQNLLPQKPERVQKNISKIVVLAIVAICTGVIIISWPKTSSINLDKLVPACWGESVEGTTGYIEGTTPPHPTVIIEFDTENNVIPLSQSHYKFHDEWDSASLSEVQLVICLQQKKVVIQGCNYEGGSRIEQARFDYDVLLINASSGKTIAEQYFRASDPSKIDCPNSISDKGVSLSKYSHVKIDTILTWVKGYFK